MIPSFHPENLRVGASYEIQLRNKPYSFFGKFVELKMIEGDFCAVFATRFANGKRLRKTRIFGLIVKAIESAFECEYGESEAR